MTTTTNPNLTSTSELGRFDALLGLAAARGARQLFLLPGEPPALRGADGRLERLDEEAVLDASWLAALARALGGAAADELGRVGGELVRWRGVGGMASICAALIPSQIPLRASATISSASSPTT